MIRNSLNVVRNASIWQKLARKNMPDGLWLENVRAKERRMRVHRDSARKSA